MKITVFQAEKGDCLLVEGPGGEHLLADGGMSFAYREHVAPALARLAAAGQALDLVYVSHIDADHIGGILELMDDTVEWRRYAFQQQQHNTTFPKPQSPQPPAIRAVWHNAFKDQVEANRAAIEDQLVANMRLANLNPDMIDAALAQQADNYAGLVSSIRDGLSLANRLSPQQLNIPVNAQHGGKVITVDQAPHQVALGQLALTIIGPAQRDLEKLRRDWNKWLEANQAAVAAVRAEAERDAATLPLSEGQLVLSSMLALAAELGRRSAVTPPNLASLMLLAEAGGRRLLLTGDGHADDILAGLARNNLLDGDGRLHLDVLKVQHHGSKNNIHLAFCQAVTADHYIFCGNGHHGNPFPEVVQTLIDARLAESNGRPFKLWFNSSARVTEPEFVEHMQGIEKLVRQAARHSRGRLRYQFLTRGSKFTLTLN